MPVAAPVSADEFGALMSGLGPFEPRPAMAAAVSGGPDSLALCLLADAWARERGGRVIALVVDHGLRPESAEEARVTRERLGGLGVAAVGLRAAGLRRGPALAARAREARYAALIAACVERGLLHLLLGHHAGDQAETRLIREQAGSGPAGLACMPALLELARVRLLRPLLGIPPERLRATLAARRVGWVEDPSNADPAARRARVRPAAAAERERLHAAAHEAGLARAEERVAAELAEVAIRPEGFAVVPRGGMSAAAWSALIRVIGSAAYPPPSAAVRRLAADPAPCTLAGVRVMPAGRLGPGLLAVREQAAIAPPVAALDGAAWDGRFRIDGFAGPGATVGALGADAARLRERGGLPAVILRTLPALRLDGRLAAVPHLGLADAFADLRVAFDPPVPAACAAFLCGAPMSTWSAGVLPGMQAWRTLPICSLEATA
jgi:tRNA(Ile)-lysidine synthase